MFLKPNDPEYKEAEEPSLAEAGNSNDLPPNIKLVLENQPKWELLHDILQEIEKDAASVNDRQGIHM